METGKLLCNVTNHRRGNMSLQFNPLKHAISSRKQLGQGKSRILVIFDVFRIHQIT